MGTQFCESCGAPAPAPASALPADQEESATDAQAEGEQAELAVPEPTETVSGESRPGLSTRAKAIIAAVAAIVLVLGVIGIASAANQAAQTQAAFEAEQQADQDAAQQETPQDEDDPEVPVEAPPPAASLTHSTTWSYSNSQSYTFDMTISLGDPIAGAEAVGLEHPNRAGYIAGANCSFDPSTSAVIPGSMTVTATTAGFATPISARFLLLATTGLGSRDDGRMNADVDYGECDYLGSSNFSLIGGVGAKWEEPMEQGVSGRMDFFLIINDYYGPATPDGDTAWLDGEAIVPDIGGSNTSNEEILLLYRPIPSSVAGISLTGRLLTAEEVPYH